MYGLVFEIDAINGKKRFKFKRDSATLIYDLNTVKGTEERRPKDEM